MTDKKKKLTGQQGELMRALNISVEDLEANDAGYVSDAQKQTVLERQRYQWLPTAFMAAFFAFMGLLISVLAYVEREDEAIVLVLSIFFFLVAAAIGTAGVLKRRKIQQELQGNHIDTTQGIAVANVGEEASYLEINGMKLNAPADVVRRVRHLDPYVVHYLPDSKVILSMEHIPDDDNIRADIATDRLEDSIASADHLTGTQSDTLQSAGS